MSSDRQELGPVFVLTWRLYRANAGPLTAVAGIATVVALAVSFARVGPSLTSFGSPSFGLTLTTGAAGSHIGFDAQVFAYGLVGLLAGAWEAATIVPLLLRRVREGAAPRYDLLAGLPYTAWVVVATLLVALLTGALDMLMFFGMQGAIGSLPLELLVGLVLRTALLFFVPLIVDGEDGLTSLLASWRLVRRSGFWRLLVYLLVAGLGLMSASIALGLFDAVLPDWAQGRFTLLVFGLVATPLMITLTTVLYLLCTGARAPLLAGTLPAADERSRGSLA